MRRQLPCLAGSMPEWMGCDHRMNVMLDAADRWWSRKHLHPSCALSRASVGEKMACLPADPKVVIPEALQRLDAEVLGVAGCSSWLTGEII